MISIERESRELRPTEGRMTKRNVPDLRSRAKAKLAQRRPKAKAKLAQRPQKSLPPGALSTELEIHRVELELQNEELLATRNQAESSLARYTEVFDFAPIGYAVIGAGGEICEINHAGAALLGAERARLVGKRLAAYVS